ncbi:MAG TPA: hypothetical protein DCG85_00605 [Lachnospiraceae bacterium]|nr:hypothetical protein [Lachnospiraceae bacterium]
MSDILKNNAISDDELGRVSGGVDVVMTPEQREAAIAFVKKNNFNFFTLEKAIEFVSTPGYYEGFANTLKEDYGIESFDELIAFLQNEWANIQ